MEIQYYWHDIILGLLFIFGVIGLRFNQWSEQDKPLYSGKPREYTHFSRFLAFYLIYACSAGIVVLFLSSMGTILFKFIETYAGDFYSSLPLLHGIRLQFGDSSLLASSILLFLLMKIPAVAVYETEWRTFLQRAARIPQAVYEKIAALKTARQTFIARERDIAPLLKKLEEKNIRLPGVKPTDFESGEGEQQSVAHLYLKVMYLIQQIRINTEDRSKTIKPYLQNVQDKEQRLFEIGMTLSAGEPDPVSEKNYRDELSGILDLAYECIARQTVTRCATEDSHRRAYLNYGLKLPYRDTRPRLEGVLWMLLAGIVAISLAITISFEVMVQLFAIDSLQRVTPGSFMAILAWVRSSAILFFSAVLIGVMAEKMFENDQESVAVRAYIWSFIVSYLLAFIYLVTLKGELHPQFYLFAASPATASTLVVWNLLNTQYFLLGSGRWTAPLRTANRQAAILALVTALICIARGVLFPTASFTLSETLGFTLFGAVMGGAQGFAIGFIFAHEIRAQLVCRNRRSPRAKFIEQVQAEIGSRNIYAATENISMTGLMLNTDESIEVGQPITLRLSFAPVVGKVMWKTGSKLGIRFEHQDSMLRRIEHFLRKQFGPQMLYR